MWRACCWWIGAGVAALALTGPTAASAHHDLTAHVAGHLLLGMVAPVFLVLAAPVSFVLRALPVHAARIVSHILAARPIRVLAHPVTAAVLNTGGMWLLYTTGLHHVTGPVLILVDLHVLAAGYLFTAAAIGVDPAPHRPGRAVRVAVLIVSFAAHGVLAKYLYAHMPSAQRAAELMYYGGDLVEVAVIAVFCAQWYAAGGPARLRPARPRWRLPEEIRSRPDGCRAAR
jgi:putative membrane protein